VPRVRDSKALLSLTPIVWEWHLGVRGKGETGDTKVSREDVG
jgi:hypothetical protein